MKSIRRNTLKSGDSFKRLFIVCVALFIIVSLTAFTLITASATATCPNCGGVGEPTGAFCDLCDSCSSCLGCGYACIDCCGEGRRCRECCCENCGVFCDTCGGCLECGSGCNPECLDCGHAFAAGYQSNRQDMLDIHDEMSPLFDLFGTPVFFFAPVGMPSWAILSVLLTIAGILLSIVTILRAVSQKKTENKNIDNQCSAMVRNVEKFNDDIFVDLIRHKERYNKKRRLAAFVSMYILSIGALIFLLIVQDFRGVIAIFDFWVIIHAILFIGVVICSMLVFRDSKDFPKNSMHAPSSP